MAVSEPFYASAIALLDGTDDWLDFEELDADATMCRARRHPNGRWAVGDAAQVIAQASGHPTNDPWVQAVAGALTRERGWRERRPRLYVNLGDGSRYHVTASTNRASIATHGLDWRYMGAAPGIAGSRRKPELPCVFLCETREGADFYLVMGRQRCDVWAVDVDGLWLESALSAKLV